MSTLFTSLSRVMNGMELLKVRKREDPEKKTGDRKKKKPKNKMIKPKKIKI